MSLSRRKFTKEFKLAAVRRLETGASVAEVARACEVNPNVLHRWRREFRGGVERAFPAGGTNYHRAVPSVLTGCLTPGGHPRECSRRRRSRHSPEACGKFAAGSVRVDSRQTVRRWVASGGANPSPYGASSDQKRLNFPQPA
jgi:transposase-like protein